MLKNKILLSIILTTFLIPANSVFAKEFPDVKSTSEYFKAISVFTTDQIIHGYPDGTFKPEQPINRAEALKIILNSFPKNESDLLENKFPDVSESDWFYKFVRLGLKHKIIEGYTDGTFKPANQVNFAEALKMGLVAKNIDPNSLTFKDFHPSVKESDWFAKYFSYGYEKNLFKTENNGGLNPIKPLTRGEFVELLYRIRAFDINTGFDISYNWKEENNQEGFSVDFPFDWKSYSLGTGSFLAFFADGNPNFVHEVENSAKVAITIWQNNLQLNKEDYFKSVKDDYLAKHAGTEVLFNEKQLSPGSALIVYIPTKGIIDLYVYINSDSILVALSSYDTDSQKKIEFEQEIAKIFEKIEVGSSGLLTTNSQKLAAIRKNILAQGKGQSMLDLFSSKELFATDTIGVGTGPVDYYYVIDINYTLKYERNSDVILDIKEGKTDAF